MSISGKKLKPIEKFIALLKNVMIIAVILFNIYNIGVIILYKSGGVMISTLEFNNLKNDYKITEITAKKVVNNYMADVEQSYDKGNYEKLYSKLDPEYKIINNMSLEAFKVRLKNIFANSKSLSYKYTGTTANNKIVYLCNITDDMSQAISILEKSPDIYTIAFDGYIGVNTTKGSYNSNGIEINLNNEYVFLNYISYMIEINNSTDKKVVLNSYDSNLGVLCYTNDELQNYKPVLSELMKTNNQSISCMPKQKANIIISLDRNEVKEKTIKNIKFVRPKLNEDIIDPITLAIY